MTSREGDYGLREPNAFFPPPLDTTPKSFSGTREDVTGAATASNIVFYVGRYVQSLEVLEESRTFLRDKGIAIGPSPGSFEERPYVIYTKHHLLEKAKTSAPELLGRYKKNTTLYLPGISKKNGDATLQSYRCHGKSPLIRREVVLSEELDHERQGLYGTLDSTSKAKFPYELPKLEFAIGSLTVTGGETIRATVEQIREIRDWPATPLVLGELCIVQGQVPMERL